MSQATESLFVENYEHFFNSIGQTEKSRQARWHGRFTFNTGHI